MIILAHASHPSSDSDNGGATDRDAHDAGRGHQNDGAERRAADDRAADHLHRRSSDVIGLGPGDGV